MSEAIAERPKPGVIYWSAYSSPEGSSQPTDPLRFDMYTQRLGNLMLPGITNRTQRLRYMSMVCAGIASTRGVGGDSLRERRRAFLPFERGWALAQTMSVDGRLKSRDEGDRPSLKPEFRGLRGANRVLSHYRGLRDGATAYPNRYVLLKSQDAQGGLGAYLVTLREFGFVHDGSLELTDLGKELASRFFSGRRSRLDVLAAEESTKRSTLEGLGRDLCLGYPTPEERRIVKEAVFGDDRRTAADCMARMKQALPDSWESRELLAAIARDDGDLLGRSANFAVVFDPLRIDLLRVFSGLGRVMEGRSGPVDLSTVAGDELEDVARSARGHAATLADCSVPDGLDQIARLAREVADGRSLADTVASTVRFHRDEGRSWIMAAGGERYSLGKHGPFRDPGSAFNGYTVDRALELLADTEAPV
jgi:hypothetical protein